MLRVDPKLAVIMISCVILSTLVVLTIIRPREEDALLLLGNEYPVAMPKYPTNIGMDTELSYSILATSEYERLELSFFCLYEKDLGRKLSSPVVMEEYPLITRLMEAVEPVGGEPQIIEASAELREEKYDAKIVDFSRFLSIFNTPSLISTLPVIFMMLTNGEEVRYFEGSPGFFLDGEETLDYLSVARNDNKTEYFREGSMQMEAPGISRAPRDGSLRFEQVGADERFSVAFSVNIAADALRQILDWTYEEHFAVVMHGYTDESLELVLVNVMPRGFGDEG